jgi:hypothetical protein
MKTLYDYITESTEPKGFLTTTKRKKLYYGLLVDDRERIEDVDRLVTHDNTIPSFEDIEKFFNKGAYKDKVDDYYGYVTGWLKNIGLTPNDVIMAYGLARSGRQSKIEVIATVIRAVITFYSFGN